MNNIIKKEVTIVQNKEGAIFKIGDIVKKAVTSRSDHYEKPSKILYFNVRKDIKNNLIITAITDFKYKSGALHKTGISIDKLELCDNPFPRCFKIRSLYYCPNSNIKIVSKINLILGYNRFNGFAGFDAYYYLNLDNLDQTGCSTIINIDSKYEEVTVEQFLKYCEDEKI